MVGVEDTPTLAELWLKIIILPKSRACSFPSTAITSSMPPTELSLLPVLFPLWWDMEDRHSIWFDSIGKGVQVFCC